MTHSAEQFPDNVDELKEVTLYYKNRANALEEKVRYLQSKLFGRKSEKHIETTEEQLIMFDEAEDVVFEEEEKESLVEVPSHKRRKRGRRPLPDHLPRIEILHDIPEDEKQCDCGKQKKEMGREISEKLFYEPAKVYVERHIRPKYACEDECGAINGEGAVIIAPAPAQIIPKSIATPSLLAHIMVSKFADALPFYRQTKIFERIGVNLPRATMCNWAVHIGNKCEILIDLMKEEIRSGPLINIDETTVQVMKEPGRKNITKSYMWVFRGGDPDKPCLVYEYHPTRAGSTPVDFLGDYQGYVQTDGYQVYDGLEKQDKVILVGCWAHARRKFAEVLKSGGSGKNRKGKSSKAGVAVKYIKQIYAIEKKAKELELSFEAVKELREKEVRPVLAEFYIWLTDVQKSIPPKSLLGKAVSYTVNQWPKLINYIKDGRITPDNNLV